jgi:hypothetical protein
MPHTLQNQCNQGATECRFATREQRVARGTLWTRHESITISIASYTISMVFSIAYCLMYGTPIFY